MEKLPKHLILSNLDWLKNKLIEAEQESDKPIFDDYQSREIQKIIQDAIDYIS